MSCLKVCTVEAKIIEIKAKFKVLLTFSIFKVKIKKIIFILCNEIAIKQCINYPVLVFFKSCCIRAEHTVQCVVHLKVPGFYPVLGRGGHPASKRKSLSILTCSVHELN